MKGDKGSRRAASSTSGQKGRRRSVEASYCTSCTLGYICNLGRIRLETGIGKLVACIKKLGFGLVLVLYECSVPTSKVYINSIIYRVRKPGESDHATFEREGIWDMNNIIRTKDLGNLLRTACINLSTLATWILSLLIHPSTLMG